MDCLSTLASRSWDEARSFFCSQASAIGANVLRSVPPSSRLCCAVIAKDETDIARCVAAWPMPDRKVIILASRSDVGRVMKTEERAERMERCAEKHAGHIILFDGKDIPWSDDWAPFTIILPFLAGRQPGSRFIQWAAKANMLTVVAKCTRLTLSASIDATSKDVFTSFCERAVPPSAFPVLPLTSAESADLMRDLFHMLDDSATGSSNAHSALHTDDDISDGDPSRWALRPPMPATASAAAASSKHDSADVFSALIRGGHRHHNRHHQRAKHEQTIKRQSDHSKSQTQEMTHPTKKQAIAGTEDIIWC